MYPYDLIEESLTYIESHLQEDLSLESIAKELGYSKCYFHRLFSAVMGVSVKNYVLERKLNDAITQVKNTEISLTDIATLYAFSTPSSFSRAFKRLYDISPSDLRNDPSLLQAEPVPIIYQRPLKNFNGDIVSDFTISDTTAFKVSGFVLQLDIQNDDYSEKIQHHANMLLNLLDTEIESPCYIIYSDCLPNSTVFNIIVGIPQVITVDQPLFFTVDVPPLFVAQFNYSGNLIEMTDVLNSDYARFLKIARQEADDSHINMIQRFESIYDLDQSYQLLVPIKRLELE